MYRWISIWFLFSIGFNEACFSQQVDSIGERPQKKERIFMKRLALPATLFGLGILGTTDNAIINHDAVRRERNEHFLHFSNKTDNILQFVPIPVVYVMDAIGLKAQHDWQQQSVLLLKSELIMVAMSVPLKELTHIRRPDSTDFKSFPSGHTAQAFTAATFFYKEYGKRYPWLSAGMFAIAGTVGTFRVLNNRHWISDVIAGSGIGILSVELAYLLGEKKRTGKEGRQAMVFPSYQNGVVGFRAFVGL